LTPITQVPAEALVEIGVNEHYTDINHPSRFEEVVRAYPRLKLVLAHLGMGAEQDTIRLTNKYPNVFTDASLRLHEVGQQPEGWGTKNQAELFRRIGIDRVLFASNYPFLSQADYVEIMEKLPLSDDERRQIGWQNYDRVYGKA
jgi:uncharacterized protein